MKGLKNLVRGFMLLLSIIVVVISYRNSVENTFGDFRTSAETAKLHINQYAKLSSDFIDLMGAYGTEYFKLNWVGDSSYYDALTYNESQNYYHLDKANEMGYASKVGNLTGDGPVPKLGDTNYKELILALNYNTYFNSFYQSLPGVAWIYYTSESGFLNLYPWVSSTDFRYSRETLGTEYMKEGRFKRNTQESRYWSQVYMDQAGKGLMITVSRAIYEGALFRGVVSLDFTLDQLNKLLPAKYKVYLVSDHNEILATNDRAEKLVVKSYTLDTFLPQFTPSEMEQLKSFPENEIGELGGAYVLMVPFYDVPWRLYFVLPRTSMLGNVTLDLVPVFIILGLLFYSTREAMARAKAENALAKTATLDFLTGALNRRGAIKRLEEETANYLRKKEAFSFIMLDIDHFKYFNDRYGHKAGDQVLVKACETLKRNVRASDLLCRWGGEEFLVVLFNTEKDQAMIIAEKLRLEIENMAIPWEDQGDLKITMTFGVQEYTPEDGLEMSISCADMAMYEGKAMGRNRVVAFTKSPEMKREI